MRVIFLDIDGVLNRTRHNTHIRLDEDKLAIFRGLVEKADAYIVLSTFWRAFRDYISYVLTRYGVPADRVIGSTPGTAHLKTTAADDSAYADRSQEIMAWLASHPEVTGFVILDDREQAGKGAMAPHFVHVQTQDGLTDEDVEKALEIITRQQSEWTG